MPKYKPLIPCPKNYWGNNVGSGQHKWGVGRAMLRRLDPKSVNCERCGKTYAQVLVERKASVNQRNISREKTKVE